MQDCYPKFIYHRSKEPKIVKSKEQHDAHGSDWQETPIFEKFETYKAEEPFEAKPLDEALSVAQEKKRGRPRKES